MSNIKPDSKLGDVWVSFYLNNIVTLRNIDWELLSEFFLIPQSMKTIDNRKIILKNNNININKKTNSINELQKSFDFKTN